MRRFLIILGLFLITHTLFGQKTLPKSFELGLDYYILGDIGDYKGIAYHNKFIVDLSKSFDIQTSLHFISHSLTNDQDYSNRHNVNYIINSYDLFIKPISKNKILIKMGGGLSFRYRSEITYLYSETVYTVNGEMLRLIQNNYVKAFDYGYNIELSGNYFINNKIGCQLVADYFGFNAGTGTFSAGIGLFYRL